MELTTAQKRVRCVCPRGHAFTASLHSTIDLHSDYDVFKSFADGGMQLVRCPQCTTVWPLAEPIIMHDTERERLAVFVPDVIAHKELEIRSDIIARLSRADMEETPLYAADIVALVGVDALERWVDDPDSGEGGRHSKPHGTVSMIPRIHSAFADLDEPESRIVSSIPPPVVEEEPEEPRAEDDWLQDSSIARPPERKIETPSRPAVPPAAEGEAEPDSGGKRSGVDFVDLMSDGEEAEDDDELEGDESSESGDDDDDGDSFGFDRL